MITPPGGARTTTFTLNGRATTVTGQTRVHLADTIRHVVGEHGTHVGCEQGACGACTVIVGGVARRSCLTLTPQVDGAIVETIESVAGPDGLDPLQQAIHDHHGLQCGYCTPGIVMSLVAARRAGVTLESALGDVLDGHLCRCTGYVNLRAAVTAVWTQLASAPSQLEAGPDEVIA